MVDDIRMDEHQGRPDLVQKRAKSILAQRIFVGLLIFTVLAALSLLVFNAIGAIQTRNSIVSCTVEGGECYEEGQVRSGQLVADLIDKIDANDASNQDIVVYAVWCQTQGRDASLNVLVNCINEGIETYGDLPIRYPETDSARP